MRRIDFPDFATVAFHVAVELLLRPRQLAARRAFLEKARYHCETCRTTWPSA
jgi:hypothetical protein